MSRRSVGRTATQRRGYNTRRVGCNFLNVEIAELTDHFKRNIIADHGQYRKAA
jgi:hypothetical protein